MDEMLAELEELFPDDVVVEPFIGEDAYGAPSFGSGYHVKARVLGRGETISDADGQEFVQSYQATLFGYYGVTAKDRFTLPVAYSTNPADPNDLEGRQPRAISVDISSDETGPHHQIVHFAKARLRGY
jgi:hypothetical protein